MGLIDVALLGGVRRNIPNALVFHDIFLNSQEQHIDKNSYVLEENAFKLITKLDKKCKSTLFRNPILTFDDGLKSPLKFLGMIEHLKPQVVLFINTDSVFRATKGSNSKYLNLSDLNALISQFSRKIQIGDHLHKHVRATEIEEEEFRSLLNMSKSHFDKEGINCSSFAWPYGIENSKFHNILEEYGYKEIFVGGVRRPYKGGTNRIARVQISMARYTYLQVRGQLLLNRILAY